MTASKKFFIASSTIFVGLLFFWGIYNLSFKKPGEKSIFGSKDNSSLIESKANSQKKILAVTSGPAIGATLVPGEPTLKYFLKDSGTAHRSDIEGNLPKELNKKQLQNIQGVYWSPDREKAIVRAGGSNGQVQYVFFDYVLGVDYPIKPNMSMISWLNNSKILYKYTEPASQAASINIADPDGANWKKLIDLENKNSIIVPVPQSSLVSYWNFPDAFTETSMYSVNNIGGEKKLLLGGKFGADFLWNGSGNAVLVSHAQEKGGSKMMLAVMNAQGGELKSLGIPTFVSKCAWDKSGNFVFCALPGSLPENAVLPNDYNFGKVKTADTFWKINVKSGEKTRLVELSELEQNNETFDAENLFLGSDESMLYFINRLNGKLYRMRI